MAKRKITVTVDEELVERAHQLGPHSTLSAVVNDALSDHVERLGRLAALGDLLDSWDRSYGPVSSEARLAAQAAFDELDATSPLNATTSRETVSGETVSAETA